MEANASLFIIIFVAIVGVQLPGAQKAGKLLTSGLERDLLMLVGHMVLMSIGPGAISLQQKR